jgi:hypothetical protein
MSAVLDTTVAGLLDHLNLQYPELQLALSEVRFSKPTAKPAQWAGEALAGNTLIRVTPTATSRLSGSLVMGYDRLPLAALSGMIGATIPVSTSTTDMAGVISDLYRYYGIAVQVTDFEAASIITAGDLTKSITLTAKPEALGWTGSAVFAIKAAPVSVTWTVPETVLGGFNYVDTASTPMAESLTYNIDFTGDYVTLHQQLTDGFNGTTLASVLTKYTNVNWVADAVGEYSLLNAQVVFAGLNSTAGFPFNTNYKYTIIIDLDGASCTGLAGALFLHFNDPVEYYLNAEVLKKLSVDGDGALRYDGVLVDKSSEIFTNNDVLSKLTVLDGVLHYNGVRVDTPPDVQLSNANTLVKITEVDGILYFNGVQVSTAAPILDAIVPGGTLKTVDGAIGQSLLIKSGTGTGTYGGNITLTAGGGVTYGGNIYLNGGAGNGAANNGGIIQLVAGSNTTGRGGNVGITAGSGGASTGGTVTITAGNSTNSQGGSVTLNAGNAVTSGVGGNVNISAGGALGANSNGNVNLSVKNSGTGAVGKFNFILNTINKGFIDTAGRFQLDSSAYADQGRMLHIKGTAPLINGGVRNNMHLMELSSGLTKYFSWNTGGSTSVTSGDYKHYLDFGSNSSEPTISAYNPVMVRAFTLISAGGSWGMRNICQFDPGNAATGYQNSVAVLINRTTHMGNGALQVTAGAEISGITYITGSPLAAKFVSSGYGALQVVNGNADIYNSGASELRVRSTTPLASNIRQQNSVSGATATDGMLYTYNGVNAELRNYEAGSITFATTNVNRFSLQATGDLLPSAGNSYALGNATYTVKNIYSANAVTVTSDRRSKDNIEDATLGLEFIELLRPVSYTQKVGSQITTPAVYGPEIIIPAVWSEEQHTPELRDADNNIIQEASSVPSEIIKQEERIPGELITPEIVTIIPGSRRHWGLIAQEVKEAVDAAGVDFGGWVLADVNDPDSQQALRYEEFISPMIRAIQELAERVRVLESKINS